MAMSRRCIPYTPRSKDLHETTFALISTARVHLRDQQPYDVEGDNSWRVLPGDLKSDDLMVTHTHYATRDASKDVNCVFPIDRLRELANAGIIGGVGDKHLGFMGYTQQLCDLYERVAPEMAKIISRSKAGAVLVTAGCPLCHRIACAIAREVEMTGLPTVQITVVPEATAPAGPPRAISPKGFLTGNSLGRPNQKNLQRSVLLDALQRWEAREEPGQIWEKVYPDYQSRPE